jgi:4-hydroxythreonine-4-phosphate dehydrogenase
VVGTAEPTATSQVEALVADGAREVTVDARALLHDKADPEQIQRALDRGSTVVTIGGVVEPSEGQSVSAALGQFIANAAAQHWPDLVLTGGETARAVIDAIGITSLRPVHEIHHGAVASVAPDGRRVVTRPGSFGDADSLVTIARYLNPQNKDNA